MAEMRRIYGEYTADGRQICGRHAPVRLADIRRGGGGGFCTLRHTADIPNRPFYQFFSMYALF